MSMLILSVSARILSRVCCPDHLAQRGLGDLVDRAADVLDGHDGLLGVEDLVVGDGGHVDADVVAGDDALGLDGHGHDPQRDAVQHVDERDDQPDPRLTQPADATDTEQDALLVLLDHPHRRGEQDEEDDDRDDGGGDGGGRRRSLDVRGAGRLVAQQGGWRRSIGRGQRGPALTRPYVDGSPGAGRFSSSRARRRISAHRLQVSGW